MLIIKLNKQVFFNVTLHLDKQQGFIAEIYDAYMKEGSG